MIIFYPYNDHNGKRLENAIATIIRRQPVVVVHELGILLEYLKQPNSEHRVLLFQAGSKEQLQQLGRKSALPTNLKKILILPDQSSSVMQAACQLYPTYMTHVLGDYKDILDILVKLKSRFSTL